MKNKLANYSPVVIFLILEVFAFVTFSFGNSFLLYSILGLVIALLIFLVSFKEIKVEGVVRSGFFIFPLFVFGLITVLSNYFKVNSDFDNVTKAFIPISLVAFSCCGSLLAINKSFKISTALLVIYSTLALVTLLNFIVTTTQFGPFHTIFYKDYYMYYGGAKSSVAAQGMAYALVGFEFNEVTIGYYSLYPTLLLTSVIMLFFVSFRKNRWIFVSYLGFFLLGFIALLFTPNWLALITDLIVIAVIIVLVLFAKKKIPGKVLLIGVIVLLALALVGLIMVFLNAQDWAWLAGYKNFIASNGFLNRLFNTNYIAQNVNAVLNNMFSKDKIFGFYFSNVVSEIPVSPSNSWLFDNLFTSGFFGAIFFLFALIFAFLGLRKYMKYSEDKIEDKTLLFAFILSFFLYTLFSGDVYYLIFKRSYNFLFVSGPFLSVICLLAYANSKGRNDCALYVERMKQNEIEA